MAPLASRMRACLGPLWLVATALSAARAVAEVRLGTVEVTADRPGQVDDTEGAPFVTVIEVAKGAPSAHAVSVADLLERQVGVRVRSLGGPGAFSTISIRGGAAGQVAIYLDGAPLGRAATGVVDLSQLPIDALERIEIHRGVPPVELSAGAVSGVIHLVSRKGARRPAWRATAGLGSFGTRGASVGHGGAAGGLHHDLSAAYHGSSGDFLYYDPGGTLIDRSDDRAHRRRNNGFDQLAIDASIGAGRRLRWRLGAHGFWKRQGVPGIGAAGAEALHARLSTARVFLDGDLRVPGRRVDHQLGAQLQYDRTLFENARGEGVGNFGPAVRDGEALAIGLRGRANAALGRRQLLSALSEARLERRRAHDLLRPSNDGPAPLRVLGAISVVDEVRLWRDRLALTPALRLDGAASTVERGADATAPSPLDVLLSPRLGLRLDALPFLALRGSAGRFVRFPTLVEQFGDGAFVLPRAGLRPEDAWGGELGASLHRDRPGAAASLELVFFGRRVDDLIAFVPSAFAVAAVNIGAARILGGELRARGRIGRVLTLGADYTLLDAVNLTAVPGSYGKQLPGRARHQLDLRADLTLGPFRCFYEAQFLDAVYRDAQNYNRLPGRWLHALGLHFVHGPFTVSVEVRNLTDLRVVGLPLGGVVHQGATTPYPLVDVFDYPLPGRAVYASIAVRP